MNKQTVKSKTKAGHPKKSESDLPDKYLNIHNLMDWVKENKPQLYKRLTQETPQASLAKLVYSWRILEGRKQEEQAELSGCSLATYEAIEEAKANPSWLILWGIAKSYKVSYQEFFAGPGRGVTLT